MLSTAFLGSIEAHTSTVVRAPPPSASSRCFIISAERATRRSPLQNVAAKNASTPASSECASSARQKGEGELEVVAERQVVVVEADTVQEVQMLTSTVNVMNEQQLVRTSVVGVDEVSAGEPGPPPFV